MATVQATNFSPMATQATRLPRAAQVAQATTGSASTGGAPHGAGSETPIQH